MRLTRAAAFAVAIGVVLLTSAGVLYARSLGPNVRAGTFSPIAVAPGPAVARVLPSPVSPATNPVAVTRPAPQGPPRSCAPLVVTSFSAPSTANRQFTAYWSATGGCAGYWETLTWYGAPANSGQSFATGPISGARIVTVSGPACQPQGPPVYATLNILFDIADSTGATAHAYYSNSVKLC